MNKRFSLFFVLSVMIFTLAYLPMGSVVADIADGTYDVPFELKESGSENTSIADGYFSKPATLIVKNGQKNIQLTITNSEWVKALSGPHGNATVIHEDEANDMRTVQLQVGDLSNAVTLKMHVVVPEDVAGMPYDHEHTVRAVFDVSNIKNNSNNEGSTSTNDGGTSTSDHQSNDVVENPQTSDNSPIALYVILLITSVAVFTFYKLR